MLRATCIAAIMGLLSAAPADEIKIAGQELRIRPQETRRFEFGNVRQQGTTVLLEVTARAHYRGLAGSNLFMRLTLNGRPVNAARSRRVMRLVNKPAVSRISPNASASWFAGAWRLIYAPDFEMGHRAPFYQGDPYTFVLDVTDLVNPVAENRLEITNQGKALSGWRETEGDVVIGSLIIRTKPEPSATMLAGVDMGTVINRGEPAAGPAHYVGEIMPGGGFALRVGEKRWEFSSAFSYPNAGLNRLTPAQKGEAGAGDIWRPQVMPAPDGGKVLADCAHYRLERRLIFGPRKVEVADTLTNLNAAAPLGLLVRHEVGLGGHEEMAVRLAGNPDPALNEYFSPPNPTVHISGKGQGLGLLCEDDVFRNQARLFCSAEPAVAGIRTEMLWLGPGQAHTLRWSVYPVAGPDYFDFINLVRDDWGSNFTVDGAWTFFSPDSILATPIDVIREKFQRLGIHYACYCGGWVDPKHDRKRIGFGTGVWDDYWADFRARLKAAASRIREALPGVKVLVYYDSQRDTSEGGTERFHDSWLTDAQGKQLLTDWGGVYSRTWNVVATPGNSFGRAMLDVAGRYLKEIGTDGLYWDEMECVAYGTPLLTYNAADGHSCLLDPKQYTIERPVGITTLLGEPHRLAVIDRVRGFGGALMGNGPPYTRAILETGVPRMIEIQHNDYLCYEGNLGTPLGYMSSRTDFGNLLRALGMACLPVGTRYDYPHEMSRYLFPFTPIELHAGYLLGKERIISVHGGNYGWSNRRSLVRVRHFDNRGLMTDRDYPTTVTTEARTAVTLGESEAIVLERLPMELEPLGDKAVASAVRYGEREISMRLTAAKGARLRIANGYFPICGDRQYGLRVGNNEPTVVHGDGSNLRITLGPVDDVIQISSR